MTTAEDVRVQFAPEKVRVLFIGESPPAGGTFFYFGNSNLYRYTQEAFSRIFALSVESPTEFLDLFQRMGFYLVDLCLEPVNKMTPVDRRAARRAGVQPLSKKLIETQPETIISVLKAIAPHIRKAAQLADLTSVPIYELVFPAMSHQQRYVSELSAVLNTIRSEGVIEYSVA